ncbi:hypothetical protein B1C78_00180 [Thioalkalivibrio denitrificans]|uniref:Uncharacterized protein n=1 Tax=Thioalkalivibrio denitrificans TaxID=108003 RepID=A0A1V3NUI3_9GAMM|nr:hypothetical protein [Thioalkalivibrio denitrificans]OOG28799.1 hypothetical protein B1C78_00180 [Thioalkalivibrio denitrificans]
MKRVLWLTFLWFAATVALAQSGFDEHSRMIPEVNQNKLVPPHTLFLQVSPYSAMDYRGVIMQGIARFEDEQGTPVEADDVALKSMGSEEDPYYCIVIKESTCRRFVLERQHLVALARFVRTGKLGVYTAPKDAPLKRTQEVQRTAAVSGLEPVRLKGTSVITRFVSVGDYIAKDLNTPFFVDLMAYIDYDESFVDPHRAHEEAEAIRMSLNRSLGYLKEPAGPSADSSWVNSDIHAYFTVSPHPEGEGLRCEGLPARYSWTLPEEREAGYIRAVNFAARPSEETQLHALATFCSAAILRALPESALEIFNE